MKGSRLIVIFSAFFVILALNYNNVGALLLDNDESIAEKLYFVFYRGSLDQNVSISLPNGVDLLQQEGFDPSKPTVFYASGFTNDVDNILGVTVIEGYLSQSDSYNVVQINYTYYSLQNVIPAFTSVPKVAQVIAKQLNVMIKAGLDDSNINLAGHSLGAQLVGNIAKDVKVELLVGLDPAGPGFQGLIPAMERGTANFTIEVHSDAGVYGTLELNGDVNYMPHDGHRFQPGCPTNSTAFSFTTEDVCSHQRAADIWGYALRHPELFVTVPCRYNGFCREKCNTSKPVYLSPQTRVRGTYFLETSNVPPYGLGMQGIATANQKSNPSCGLDLLSPFLPCGICI